MAVVYVTLIIIVLVSNELKFYFTAPCHKLKKDYIPVKVLGVIQDFSLVSQNILPGACWHPEASFYQVHGIYL